MGMIVAHFVSHSHPIRVLLDGTAIPADLGGVGRYVDDLVPELVEQGVDLTMAVQERDAEHFATRLPSARIIPISRRFESRPARMAWEQTGLPKLIRKVRPDVLHSPRYSCSQFPGVPGGGSQGGGERVRVGWLDEQPGVAGDLFHAGARARDDGGPVGHGLKDGQAEALPQGREGEDAGARVGTGQVGVVEAAQDMDAVGCQGRVGGVRAPSGGTDEDQIEVGVLHLPVGGQEGRQVLAGLAGSDPQDVGAGQVPTGAEVLDLVIGDGRVAQAVRDDSDEGGIQARLDAVVGGGLGGDDDRVGARARDLEGAVEVGGSVGREVVGVAQEGDVVDGDGHGARGRRDGPGGGVDDVGGGRGRGEQAVHAGGAQAVPGGVEGAARQRAGTHGDGQADLAGRGGAGAVAGADADGTDPAVRKAGGDLDDVPAGPAGHGLPHLLDDHSNVDAHDSRVVHGPRMDAGKT